MPMPRSGWLVAVALASSPLPCAGDAREIVADPLVTAERWQLGGRRINYVLGESAVSPSREEVHGDAPASLKLTYDFREPQRDYLSYYHVGDAIPGVCREVLFWLFGNASGCRVRLSIEDAQSRWFERDIGAIDWTGWRQVRTTIGEGQDWRPLLRRGEARLPVLQPVNLRQIALYRGPTTEPQGAVCIQDLRAETDLVPADFVSAVLATGKPASLFDLGEPVVVKVTLTNQAPTPVTGRLSGAATDFLGRESVVDLGEVSLPAGATVEREFRRQADRTGPYSLRVTLKTDERERMWFGRFAVIRPMQERPPDRNALFGCCFTISGFSQEQMPTVFRLNRDAGIRWERLGFGWGEINPAPGRFAWDGPRHVDGPVGQAVELDGQVYQRPHTPALDCPDAVAVAFWARGTQANGAWQAVVQKWGAGNERNYGCYFGRDNGDFCFSASYTRLPEAGWHDVNSGFSAWDGKWHHYAATYSRDAKRVALYVDGELRRAEDLDGGDLRTNKDDLVIGSGYPGGLDELVLYRRALTGAEVKALADKATPPQEGLIAWWSFEEAGTVVKDRSASGLDLSTGDVSAARVARLGLEHGVKTLGILGFPANWASTAPEDADRPWVYKPKLDAWATFVENTTRHYRDLVQHWEIWNEPNITVFWLPQPSAKEFLDVVKVGYEAAKRGNPNCTVLMPGLAGPGQGGWGMDFLDELLELGAAKYCDAISIHPYRQASPEGSDLVGDLRHIAALAERNGGRRPIWFTEDCWTTDLPGGSTEERAARMLPRCYALALGTGLMERFIFFRLHDPGVDRFYGEHNYGMCWNDLTPKPAYFAHATTARLLDGARPEGEWDVGPRALARVFRTKAERVAAVWSPEGTAPASVSVGRPTVRLVDIMGNESSVPTEGGVLLLNATEDVTFLRDLPPQAEGRGTLLACTEPTLTRGSAGELKVTVRNPFAKAQRAVVAVSAGPPLRLTSARAGLDVPANGKGEATFAVSAAPEAEAGRYGATVSLEFGGGTWAQEARIDVRSAAPDAGPAGHWKLDEGQGTVIRDSSPNGNDGTVDQPKWVEGRIGKALQFDGAHIAVIPDSPSLNLTDEVTLAFWFRLLAATGNWQFPVGKYLQENIRRNYGIYIHKDTLAPCFSASFEEGSYLHSDVATAESIDDGEWHHLAVTYSMFDQRVRLYLDGKVATDQAFSEGRMLTTTDPVRLGVGTVGIIDEVVVYPRALAAEEIAKVMRG
jgi:polysaccharide biosynthesis protein PslG